MTNIDVDTETKESARPQFFVWMAGVCVLIAFTGFIPTYFAPIATDTLREISPIVHIHGFLFFSWTLYFLLQTTLVARGHVNIHRTVGLAGISLATALVIIGLMVNILANNRRIAAGDIEAAFGFIYFDVVTMFLFAAMVGVAIKYIKRPDWHKRLMLFATITILVPAIFRVHKYIFDLQPPALYWSIDATTCFLVIATLVYDWTVLGRPHMATLIAGPAMVAVGPFTDIAIQFEFVQSFAHTWVSLAN